MKDSSFRIILIFLSSCILLALLSACGSGDPAAGQKPALPVQVVEAERRNVQLIIEMIGSTLGTQDIPIRARVEGFLETMDFHEGRFVKKGQLLYTIDDQPFQAKLVEAQSQLAVAQTELARANSDLGRIRPLAEMKAVSERDLDSAVAEFDAARAGVRAGEATVELARIELGYTKIYAPITGLIGLSKAKPGEFVGRDPNPVVLNVLSDIDPIRVRFSISEREYLIIARTFMSEGKQLDDIRADRPNLDLILADGTKFEHGGVTAGAAQSINPETGTYTIEALFPNPDHLLLPGQFARVRAPYTELKNVVVVPRKSLSELQGRFRVYVVAADNTVEVREVQLGPIKGNDQVIESGLEGGELIIVEGLQKVRAGMVVKPTLAIEAATLAPIQAT